MFELPDLTLMLGQLRSGLTTAMFLFLIASGLSLIFGVLKIINFAHGSLYMIGAYTAWHIVHYMVGNGLAGFAFAVLVAATIVGIVGGLIERLLLRHMYHREELYQLLFTYALVLVFADACKYIWGTQPVSVQRPELLAGYMTLFNVRLPYYDSLIIIIGLLIAGGFWLMLNRTAFGRIIRAAALDREMLGALGTNVSWLYTSMFILASFLAGLSGALVTPIKGIAPGLDVDIIIEVFIVVVIGGLGSVFGTLYGSLAYGITLAFGILIQPRFSIVAAFILMAVVLVIRPWCRSQNAALAYGVPVTFGFLFLMLGTPIGIIGGVATILICAGLIAAPHVTRSMTARGRSA
ncbi:MAG: branched-chain amino acid ABC transporter permease [Hyphomicrobiaceae bacterium]